MHSRDRTPFRSRLRPFLLGHCFFSSFLLLCQVLPQTVHGSGVTRRSCKAKACPYMCKVADIPVIRYFKAELQRSCSQLGSQRRVEHCQSLCHCRYYPPLPPPPPPPPPPRLLIPTVAEPPVPLLKPWWMDFIVVVTVGCTSAFFLILILLICYKAIKRKPLKKEENGTSRGEYAMSCPFIGPMCSRSANPNIRPMSKLKMENKVNLLEDCNNTALHSQRSTPIHNWQTVA